MLQIAICDDDGLHLKHTRKLAESILAAHSPVIAEFGSANELLFKMEGTAYVPNIALLDIQMPGVDGIELAGEINRIAPECKIVFVSSYIFYAPDVYNTEHIYFVLKSQMDERLPMALEKAVASISKPRDFMLIKAGALAMRIPTDTVMYLERALHKTKVVTASESYMTTQSPAELLKNVEDKNAFIHCHQSYWVNVQNIATMELNGFKLLNDAIVPISRAQKSKARDAFFRMLAEKK